jgi:hypothetical protein
MDFNDVELGMTVKGRWRPEWGQGIVTKKLSTVVYVRFENQQEMIFNSTTVKLIDKADDEAH